MAYKFYHIGVLFPFQPRSHLIDGALTAAARPDDDWVRYAPNCWIVWTERSAEQIYNSMSYLLNQTEQVFIVEINLQNRHGMLLKAIWDWLDSKQKSPELTLAELINYLPPPPDNSGI